MELAGDVLQLAGVRYNGPRSPAAEALSQRNYQPRRAVATADLDREGPEISGRGPPARASATKPRKWPCAERPIARVSRG